jgi:cellulose synthase/poly-beta-1,6-N-acetylglucosamine synthase-like glycosyltransferase
MLSATIPAALTPFILGVYFIVLVVLSFYGSHRYTMVYLYKKYARGADPAPLAHLPDAQLPAITVQLPMFNERYVAQRLIDAACAIDYPPHLLQIQLLDDSTDDTTDICARLADSWRARGVDVSLIHRTDRTGYKAGALEHGLATASGDLVAIFDADFIPPTTFLRDIVHHFSDPQIGMVQARWTHLNRDYSLLTRAQAILLDGHFVIEHTARNRSGRLFNFNGTAGVWRKQAIHDAGGWQHDTLTEDLDLSYRAQLAGWRFRFLRDLTVPSEIPVEMNAFKAQQHRWAKGSTQTALKLLPRIWRSPLPWHLKLEATRHLTANMAYLLMLVLATLMPVATLVRLHQGLYEALMIDLPIFLSATLSICVFYWTSQREQGRSTLDTLRMMPAVLGLGIGISVNNAKAVVEALVGHQAPFVRTPKDAIERRGQSWRSFSYINRSSLITAAELALAGWFALAIARILQTPTKSVFSLPFLLLFFFGFGYVAILSILQTISWPAPKAPDL